MFTKNSVQLILPLYKWQNGGMERFSDLPKVTQRVWQVWDLDPGNNTPEPTLPTKNPAWLGVVACAPIGPSPGSQVRALKYPIWDFNPCLFSSSPWQQSLEFIKSIFLTLTCPEIWSNIIVGVSVGVFLDEITTGQSEADCSSQRGWPLSNQLKTWPTKSLSQRDSCQTAALRLFFHLQTGDEALVLLESPACL